LEIDTPNLPSAYQHFKDEAMQLKSALEAAPVSNAGTQLDHLMKNLDAFTGGVPPFDDVTLFVVTLEQNT
jgi:hypothetical protein